MAIPPQALSKLSIKKGKFVLHTKYYTVDKVNRVRVRYPKVELKSNRVKVGCVTVTKEAAQRILDMLTTQHTGVVQEEGIHHEFEPVYDLPDVGYKVVKA